MKIVGEFDRADEAEFNSLGSKAPFKVEGDLLYRTAYTQPSDISGPTYTYLVTFEEDSDRIISCSIIAKDECVTTTVDRKSTRLNSSHSCASRLPSYA